MKALLDFARLRVKIEKINTKFCQKYDIVFQTVHLRNCAKLCTKTVHQGSGQKSILNFAKNVMLFFKLCILETVLNCAF